MMVFYIVSIIIALLFLLYVLVFVRPGGKPYDSRFMCDYAHRGLHGKTVPENSLTAFEKACENNYGIELDVQLSKDGKVMVFHDYSLKRMTGLDKKLCELNESELQSLTLKDSGETIPTLENVLRLVDSRVPLLVELKGESIDSSLCGKVAELLKEYKGDYCIESFNPLLIKVMKKYLPDAYYGQLYTNVCRDKKKYSPLNILLTGMVFNFIARPDFIAYNKHDRNAFPVKIATVVFKAPKFVWTLKNEQEISLAKENCENAIFELENI